MILMMFIQFLESLCIYFYYMLMKICPWNLYVFFAMTVMPGCSDTAECQLKALQILSGFAKFCSNYAYMTMYFLNICLSIDFILMIRYPFKNSTNRESIFIVTSLVLGLMQLRLIKYDEKHGTELWTLTMVCIGGISFLMIIATVVYALIKLNGNSISNDIVAVIFKRHLLLVCVVLLCDSYSYVGYIYFLFHKDAWTEDGLLYVYGGDPPGWLAFMKLLYMYSGFILPCIRLSEPLFYRIIFKMMRDFFSNCFNREEYKRELEVKESFSNLNRGLPRLISKASTADSINSEVENDSFESFSSFDSDTDFNFDKLLENVE